MDATSDNKNDEKPSKNGRAHDALQGSDFDNDDDMNNQLSRPKRKQRTTIQQGRGDISLGVAGGGSGSDVNSHYFSKMTLQRTTENDPLMTELHIYSIDEIRWEMEVLVQVGEGIGVYATNIHFDSIGKALGANKHVKKLVFMRDTWLSALSNKAFFEGVKQNTSVSQLHFLSKNISHLLELELLRNVLTRQNVLTDELIERGYGGIGFGVAGCEFLSQLLQEPNCNLVSIDLYSHDSVNDDCAIILATALRGNKSLETLRLSPNVRQSISGIGWAAFGNALCAKSSINDTYLSNHTLKTFGDLPVQVSTMYSLYYSQGASNKKEVATKKIRHYHQHLDMKPFFEFEKMKMLPVVVTWLDIAQGYYSSVREQARLAAQKQDAIYQFIHAMPETLNNHRTTTNNDIEK